jgi:nitrogen fixation NifU-like protein
MSLSGRNTQEKDELDELAESIVLMMEQEDAKIYSRETISEFRNPANVGRMEDADGVGIADGLCADTMEMYIKLDGGRIQRCTFFTDGCGATIACGSRLTRLATGMTVQEAKAVGQEELISLLNGLPKEHEHCAALAVIALRNAIRDCERRVEGGQG